MNGPRRQRQDDWYPLAGRQETTETSPLAQQSILERLRPDIGRALNLWDRLVSRRRGRLATRLQGKIIERGLDEPWTQDQQRNRRRVETHCRRREKGAQSVVPDSLGTCFPDLKIPVLISSVIDTPRD